MARNKLRLISVSRFQKWSQTIGWLEVAVKDARGVRCDESVENTQRYADSLLLHQEAACVRVSLRGWGGERCRRGYPSFMGRGL